MNYVSRWKKVHCECREKKSNLNSFKPLHDCWCHEMFIMRLWNLIKASPHPAVVNKRMIKCFLRPKRTPELIMEMCDGAHAKKTL